MVKTKTLIVTRHPAAVEWIQKHHPQIACPPGSRVRATFDGETIDCTILRKGTRVVGTAPGATVHEPTYRNGVWRGA